MTKKLILALALAFTLAAGMVGCDKATDQYSGIVHARHVALSGI